MLTIVIFIITLAAILTIRTLSFKSKQITTADAKAVVQPVDELAIKHLSEAIRIPTISYDDTLHGDKGAALYSFGRFLRIAYPQVFSALQDTVFSGGAILLKWQGFSDEQPAIFYAHMDVVPIEENSLTEWKHQPFSGDVADNFIWGRGAIDDKGSLISLFEAVNKLVQQGFKPAHTIYIACGSDEEIGGDKGAGAMADYCRHKNLHFAFYLDEGGFVSHQIVPNVNRDVALIGTSEKGYVTFELTVEMPGGHSSKPPKETSLDVLMQSAVKIDHHEFEKRAVQSIDEFMDYVGPEMQGMNKVALANRWLFKPLILSQYAQAKESNAMVRTTGVTTVLNAGVKENLIPSRVSAKANFRVLPGETVKEVELEIENAIDDKRVQIKPREVFEPSKTTGADSWGFQLLQQTSSKIFPDAIVTPFLMIGSTDSKHFEDISDNIYRFFPTRMDNEALSGFHGLNERIKVQAYMETIAFYKQLITDMQTFKRQTEK